MGVVDFFPIIICPAVHNRHAFVLAVVIKLILFERHSISNWMFNQHQAATSTFLLNFMFFTWAKRWRARAEQFSCLASDWCHASGLLVVVVFATGGLSTIDIRWGGPSLAGLSMVLLSSDGCYCEHRFSIGCGSGGGDGMSSIITQVSGNCNGSGRSSRSWVARETTPDERVVRAACELGWDVVAFWLGHSIYSSYNFITSPICSWTCVLIYHCDFPR